MNKKNYILNIHTAHEEKKTFYLSNILKNVKMLKDIVMWVLLGNIKFVITRQNLCWKKYEIIIGQTIQMFLWSWHALNEILSSFLCWAVCLFIELFFSRLTDTLYYILV